jgi:hypothetical protein
MGIVLLEGFGQLKNPVTSSGIEPATTEKIHIFFYLYPEHQLK